MRALTIRQPWATLIALGVKTIETRSWPAPASLIGQHFAIHAGLRHPARDWPWPSGRPFTMWDGEEGDGCVLQRYGCHQGPDWPDPDSYEVWPMPLGAIVATARLVDCVPITDRRYMPDHGPQVTINPATGTLRRIGSPLSGIFDDVTDQLPYGDFTPGRWAWLLDDVKPTTERCPACMGSGYCPSNDAVQSLSCRHCRNSGGVQSRLTTCPPIPAKGRPGLSEWTP